MMTEQPAERKRKDKRLSPPMRFFLVVVAIYVVCAFMEPTRTLSSLLFSQKMLVKLVPILIFVFVLMFLSNLLIRPRWVRAHVGRGSGLKGYLVAAVGGIFSIGPIYLWFEFLKEMQGKGMRSGLMATFIYARSVKPQLLPLMILYFGWAYTLVLEAYLILFSLAHGWLMQFALPDRNGVVEGEDSSAP